MKRYETTQHETAQTGLRGVVRYFMTEVVQDQVIGICSGIFLLFLFALELLVLGLQIEGCVSVERTCVVQPRVIKHVYMLLALCRTRCIDECNHQPSFAPAICCACGRVYREMDGGE